MKLDAALPSVPLSQIPAIARSAEEMGFAALWSTETQHDPFLPHTLIAEHTSRLEMGTGIAVSFARSPANLAYTAWDLAAQSNGRFILGLGTQVKAHIERRFGAAWPESVTGKLREQIQVIRAFWNTWQTGAPLNFRGEYYKITLMAPFFNPGKLPFLPVQGGAEGSGATRSLGSAVEGALPPIFDAPQSQMGGPRGAKSAIPIYIAGVNTGLARLAGELCDGFLVHPFHTPRYLDEVLRPAIAGGLEKEGRAWNDLSVAVTAFVATNAAERAACRQQISFYASTPSYRAVMDLHGWGETAEQLSALAARGKWDEMPTLISDEMLVEFAALAETPSGLAEALRARYAATTDRLSLYLPFQPGERDGFWREMVEALGEEKD